MWTWLYQNWEAVVGLVGLSGGGGFYVRSTRTKQIMQELQGLAEVRGQSNEELRHEVEQLRIEVANVRGQMEALQRLKAQEIALEMARLIDPNILTAIGQSIIQGRHSER